MFKRMSLSIFATLLIFSQFLPSKAGYEVIALDYRAEYYDPYYFCDIESSVWENNILVNFTIKEYLPMDTEVKIELLGATMGEYIVKTGIEMQLPLCDTMKDPYLGKEPTDSMKPPMDECPPKPGTYTSDMDANDFTAITDSFPPGHYLMKTTIFTPEKLLAEIHYYERIE